MKNLHARQQVTPDTELNAKIRQVAIELAEWHEKAVKGRLNRRDIERMKFEADELQKLLANREL